MKSPRNTRKDTEKKQKIRVKFFFRVFLCVLWAYVFNS